MLTTILLCFASASLGACFGAVLMGLLLGRRDAHHGPFVGLYDRGGR